MTREANFRLRRSRRSHAKGELEDFLADESIRQGGELERHFAAIFELIHSSVRSSTDSECLLKGIHFRKSFLQLLEFHAADAGLGEQVPQDTEILLEEY